MRSQISLTAALGVSIFAGLLTVLYFIRRKKQQEADKNTQQSKDGGTDSPVEVVEFEAEIRAAYAKSEKASLPSYSLSEENSASHLLTRKKDSNAHGDKIGARSGPSRVNDHLNQAPTKKSGSDQGFTSSLSRTKYNVTESGNVDTLSNGPRAQSSDENGKHDLSPKPSGAAQEFSPLQVAETLMKLSKPGALSNLSYSDGCVLKYTVSFVQGKERARILETIASSASFSVNLPILTTSGCLKALQDLLKQTAKDRRSNSENEKIALLHSLTNISCSDGNQELLKTSVEDLFSLSEGQEESRIGLACLCVIANLSLTNHCHTEIAKFGTRLFELLEEEDTALLKQVLTILLNLCCEPSTVKLLLTAKAPSEMATFVARTGTIGKNIDLQIKWLRILMNLYKVIREEEITAEKLMNSDNCELDGTVYEELQNLRLHMKACVFLLCHNKESRGLASSAKMLYEYLETTQ